MSWLLASVLQASVAMSAQAMMADEMNVAHRLIAAIRNKAAFQEADFIKPPGERDKAFLATYSRCKVAYVRHSLISPPGGRGPFTQTPGSISLGWQCKRTSKDVPVHFTLLFRDGKIERIETHKG